MFTTVTVLGVTATVIVYFWLRPIPRLAKGFDDFFEAAGEHEINWLEVRCSSRMRLDNSSGRTDIETKVAITGLLETKPILRFYQTWIEPVDSGNIIEAMNLVEPTSRKVLAQVVLLVKAFRSGMLSTVRIRLILRNLPEGHFGEYTEYGQIVRLVD